MVMVALTWGVTILYFRGLPRPPEVATAKTLFSNAQVAVAFLSTAFGLQFERFWWLTGGATLVALGVGTVFAMGLAWRSDAVQVHEWMAAGHEIGAHTCTHPWLTRIPLAEAREEIFASKARLEDLFGSPVRHFCYPYGDWNPAVRDLVVEAGYATACTTEPGLNRPEGDPFRLRRLTARYASRNWANVWRTIRGLWGG